MRYVKFGNAGVEVSAVCLGAMTFYERNEESVAIGMVRRAYDLGVNFIDTADSYGLGKSEQFLSRALAGIREHIFLCTKFYIPYAPTRRAGGGLACSRAHIVRAVETSLKNLGTEYVDLLLMHHPNPAVSVEETLSAMDQLVRQGKVLYLGVSNHFAWQMAHMLGVAALHAWEPIICVQARYNMLDRLVEQEMVPFCQRFNMAMMAYGPQDGGILADRYQRGEPIPEGSRVAAIPSMQAKLTDEFFDLLDQIREIGLRNGMTLAQLAIRWLLEQPFCCVPVLGGGRPEHFDPLYEAVDKTLPPDDLALLNKLTYQYKFGEYQNQPFTAGSSPALNWW
jgi:aryl-alcohol dehydrogenase-like predicted oxidoreductase